MEKNKIENKKSIDQIAEDEKKKEKDITLQNEKKDKEEDGDDSDKERHGVSCILEDGSLIEMIYNAKKGTSKLAVYKDGKVSLEDGVSMDDSTVFMPLDPKQSILKNNYVLFASGASDYPSNEALYQEVRVFVEKFVQLPDTFLSVVSVYIMMSWVYDKFQNIPYLHVVGLYGTGKSRLLSVAGHLCYKSVMAGGSISNAALFRTLDLFNPTLVFDEAELSETESSEMRQVLRQGYSAGTPVSRIDKSPSGKMYIQTFNVFGPKIIASYSKFQDIALESRCLTAWMYPLSKIVKPIQLSEQFKEEALLLRNKLMMFRLKNHQLVVADEESLGGVSLPRLKQTGLAVVSVAKILGLQALDDVVSFLNDYEKVLRLEQADSVEHDVLLCVLGLLTDKQIQKSGKIRIGSDLADAFNMRKYEDYSTRENKEYNSIQGPLKYPGQKVSPKKIGGYVRKLGLSVERDGDGFYIYVLTEYSKIQALARRYGLDSLYTLPEDPTKLKEVLTQEELNGRALQKEIEAEWEKNKNIAT